MDESSQISTQCLSPTVSCGMGMQIPPKDPESWYMRIYPKDITETAERGAGSRNRNDRL